MRLCYVHRMAAAVSRKGGPGVHVASSVAALRSLGHEVTVLGPALDVAVAPADPTASRPPGALRRLAARFGYQPRALVQSLGRVRSLHARARAAAPDVLLARYEAFDVAPLVVARRLGVPLVWEINGTSREIGWWNPSLWVYPGTVALERWLLDAAAASFVVSEELRDLLAADGVDVERVAVVPNGADPDRFPPRAPDASLPGVPADAPVVGFLGSFSRWHDVPTMAAALPRIAAAVPDTWFVLAGATVDELPAAAREAVASLGGRVLLPGVVPIAAAPRWIARFDVALSLYPPIAPFYFSPVKLFEYLAAGCAVVATAIGQQARVVRDGVNGRLVAPGDVDAVVGAAVDLLRAPETRRRLGAAARDGVVRQYTWRHNAERIAALCEAARAARTRGGRVVLSAAAVGEPA